MKKRIPNYRRLRIRQQLQVKLLNFIIAMVIFILLDYIFETTIAPGKAGPSKTINR